MSTTHFFDDTSSKAEAEITRPNDTTAYIAKDVIASSTSSPVVITFSDMARVIGGSGVIIRARLMTDQKTNTASYRLHLFHTAPTAIADNSPYTMLYLNATNRIGAIDFGAMATEDATNSTAAATMRPSYDGSYPPPNLWFKTNSDTKNIYGILTTLSAFTPAAQQKFFIELSASLD